VACLPRPSRFVLSDCSGLSALRWRRNFLKTPLTASGLRSGFYLRPLRRAPATRHNQNLDRLFWFCSPLQGKLDSTVPAIGRIFPSTPYSDSTPPANRLRWKSRPPSLTQTSRQSTSCVGTNIGKPIPSVKATPLPCAFSAAAGGLFVLMAFSFLIRCGGFSARRSPTRYLRLSAASSSPRFDLTKSSDLH